MINISKLKTNLIYENSTISKVIKSLEISKEKICLIFNSKKKFCGVITDGDLRRILLRSNDLSSKINKFYNKKYLFCYKSDSHEKVKKKFLNNHFISCLPVLDKNKKILGVYSKNKFFEDVSFQNEVFIFAGGLGKRLYPLTNHFPKPMLSFAGRPLLESIIYSLKSSGFKNINFSVSYLQDKIINYFKNGENYNLRIRYFSENKKLGTAGPLFFLKKYPLD